MRSVPASLVAAVILIQLAHLMYFDPFVGTYGDTAGYVGLAADIFGWPAFATYYQPLYPAFLRMATLLSSAEQFRRVAVLAQVGMVVATSLLIYRIALRLVVRRWLAAAAALLVALDIRITIYEYLLLTEILAIFLSVCFLYAMSRALADDSRLAPPLAALALLALALTKVSFVSLAFVASALFALLAWRFRQSALAAPLRRCAIALSVTAVVLAAKTLICYGYTGMVSTNTEVVLQQFLSVNPEIVLRLPDGDPALAKFKEAYRERGHFLSVADRFGGFGPVSSRATVRIYLRAVLSHPLGAAKAALIGYYRQNRDNYLFIYPEETNVRVFHSARNALFAIERGLNAAVFGGWPGLVWNSLCLLLGALCLLTPMPPAQKVALALLVGFTVYTIGVSTCLFGGFWIGDNSRMRLMYEAPLIVLWVFVPARVVGLARALGGASRG